MDYIVIGSLLLSIIMVFMHVAFYILSGGYTLEILKSFLFKNGAWLLEVYKDQGVKLKFASKVSKKLPRKEGGFNLIEAPHHRNIRDGKPFYAIIEGEIQNADLRKPYPADQKAEIVFQCVEEAHQLGYLEGMLQNKEDAKMTQITFYMSIVAAIGALVILYLIWFQVMPDIDLLQSGITAIKGATQALQTVGLVPGA